MALRFLADSLAALAQATHSTQRTAAGFFSGISMLERLGMAGLLRHLVGSSTTKAGAYNPWALGR